MISFWLLEAIYLWNWRKITFVTKPVPEIAPHLKMKAQSSSKCKETFFFHRLEDSRSNIGFHEFEKEDKSVYFKYKLFWPLNVNWFGNKIENSCLLLDLSDPFSVQKKAGWNDQSKCPRVREKGRCSLLEVEELMAGQSCFLGLAEVTGKRTSLTWDWWRIEIWMGIRVETRVHWNWRGIR